jgi:sugar/nucleoside kinase (ribokinase family)
VDSDEGGWGAPWLGRDILPLVDFIKVNHEEAEGIWRAHRAPTEHLMRPVEWLARKVRCCALVTGGTKGCTVGTRTDNQEIVLETVPSPVVQVVDAVGAGDAFNAGFIMKMRGTVDNNKLLEAVEFGCACGALAVTRLGACQTPVDLPAVQALLDCRKAKL